jgi:tetratricopeptide (TPR) repeat protein
MVPTSVKLVLMLGIVALLGGCDPEALIKAKVPAPIKDLLTSRGQVIAKKALSLDASLKIKSPKPDQVFPADKNVTFQAELKKEEENDPQPELVWKVVAEKQDKGHDVGQGLSATKPLKPGNYRAELHATMGEKRVVKKVNFRVTYMITGSIATKDGKGVAEADVELLDPTDRKSLSATKSRGDGLFNLELPADGEYLVAARKTGFLLSPVTKEIKSARDAPVQFSAQKGEVSDIRIIETESSEEQAHSVCPSETLFLKANIQLSEKPVSLEVFLVDPKKEGKPEAFEVKDSGNLESQIDAVGRTKVAITAPSAATIGHPANQYIVRIKITDEKRDSYFVELPKPIAMDYAECFRKRLAEGLDLQLKGKEADAVKLYTLMEEMFNFIYDVTSYTYVMEKALFNRGIAYIKLAVDETQENARLNYLNRSIQDFNRLLKARKNDGQAYMLRGVAYDAKGDHKTALKDYDASIEFLPQQGAVYELRGLANLKTGTKKNLLQAIDDFTIALETDPGDKVVRETRREVTKIAAKTREDADDRKVDVSQVPVRPLTEWLDLQKYLRK